MNEPIKTKYFAALCRQKKKIYIDPYIRISASGEIELHQMGSESLYNEAAPFSLRQADLKSLLCKKNGLSLYV